MKININFLAIIFLCLLTIVGCKDDDPAQPSANETCTDGIQNQDETDVDCGGVCDPCFVPEPEITGEYFMKFKIDGVWDSYQTNSIGTCQDGSSYCFLVWFDRMLYLNTSEFNVVPYIAEPGSTFTFDDVELAEEYDYSYFRWLVDGVNFSTSRVPAGSQDGFVTISNLEILDFYGYAGGWWEYDLLVEGSFAGKIADDDGNIKEVTEGTFRFKADY